jgi:hypothetical protein
MGALKQEAGQAVAFDRHASSRRLDLVKLNAILRAISGVIVWPDAVHSEIV